MWVDATQRRSRAAPWVAATWVSLALFTACLLLLFQAGRAVLDVGGFCALGGPYEIAVECPPAIGLMFPASILLGFASIGAYVMASMAVGAPRLWLLAWSALFLLLGWNFLEYGIWPQVGSTPNWAFLICGVVFWVLGGVPLRWLLRSPSSRAEMLGVDDSSRRMRPTSSPVPMWSLSLSAIVAGVLFALWFFRAVT